MLTEETRERIFADSIVSYRKTPYMKMWKDQGILFCEYADKIEIDLETAKQCVKSRVEFSGGINSLVLINMKGVKSLSKAAREYLAEEGIELIKAGAFLTGSALTKMLVNIFLSINKPKVPTRFFSDESEATAWLKKYL